LPAALADCNESLRLHPGEANIFNTRGLVQLKLGAFDRAIADYGTVIEKRQKDANSLYGRGLAKLKAGDKAGGEADIAQVFAGYGVK
jgi:tetratricopeptide (TPR) repeat protein